MTLTRGSMTLVASSLPAHAYFENGNFNLPAGKIFERHRGQHLEKTGMPGQFALPDQTFGGAVHQVVH